MIPKKEQMQKIIKLRVEINEVEKQLIQVINETKVYSFRTSAGLTDLQANSPNIEEKRSKINKIRDINGTIAKTPRKFKDS